MTDTWTRDGGRPWHHRFTVRPLGGSDLGLWIGGFTPDRWALARAAAADRGADFFALSGAPWEELAGRGALAGDGPIGEHPGQCSGCGWLGVGILPRDPRPAASVWEGWAHLDHAPRCDRAGLPHRCENWRVLLPRYDWLAGATTRALALALGVAAGCLAGGGV